MAVLGDTSFQSAIVIGSSPLMLMQSLRLSQQGYRVTVLEADANPGGLWRMETLDDGTRVECACHLIDDLPNVYPELHKYSGAEFAPLVPQPEHINERGDREAYVTRSKLLRAVATDHGRVFKIAFRRALGYFGNYDQVALDLNRTKLIDFYHYGRKTFVPGPVIQAPIQGYGHFMDGLLANVDSAGISILNEEVMEARRSDGAWTLITRNGTSFRADRVDCNGSASLRLAGNDRFVHFETDRKPAYNFVLSVLRPNVRRNLSYVSFARHPQFSRVARLDLPDSDQLHEQFLVQLRTSEKPDRERIMQHATQLFMDLDVISDPTHLNLKGMVSLPVRAHNHDQQLPDGEVRPGFHVWSSLGNLASGVAFWRDGKRRVPWRSHVS